MSQVVTKADQRRAEELMRRPGKMWDLADFVALALAEERDAKERAQAGFASHDAALCRERAKLTGALARIAKLEAKLLEIAETPEAVAVRHLKGVDQDPVLRPAEGKQT